MPQIFDDGPPGVLSMWCLFEPAAKQPQYRTNKHNTLQNLEQYHIVVDLGSA